MEIKIKKWLNKKWQSDKIDIKIQLYWYIHN